MKKIILLVVTFLVVGGGAFYGGMKYANASRSNGQFARGNFTGGANGARAGRAGGFTGGANGANVASGEILSKDATSITLKLRDGGSKIVFYAPSTEVGKFVTGTPDDLAVGQTIVANGSANTDGSITAQSIQVRPPMPTASAPSVTK